MFISPLLKPLPWATGAVLLSQTALAAICFLPDCNTETSDKNFNADSLRCKQDGYAFYASGSCPPYAEQDTCEFNPNYLKCNKELWCKNNSYTITSCRKPQYPADICPNSLEYYKSCKTDFKRACQEENASFTDTCPSGWQVDPNKACSYSSDFGICCNTCSAYTAVSNTPPRGYKIDGECDSCNGKRYKLTVLDCPSGYTAGLTSCSGNGYSYSSSGYSGNNICGKCTATACPAGYSASVTSCGSGYSFSTSGYSGGKACGKCTYVANGCPSGYVNYNEKNIPYRNRADLAVVTSDKVCIPSSAVYYNASTANLKNGTGYVYSSGTYTLNDIPIIDTQTSGTLTINGSIGIVNVFMWSSGRINVNGDFYNLGAVWLANGAKLCISGKTFDKTPKPPFSHHSSWCTRNWTGWGNDGDGPCYFDGNCYY